MPGNPILFACSLGTVRERLSLVSPAGDQYADTVDKSAARIVVGAVYYATFAHCGLKAETEVIYA